MTPSGTLIFVTIFTINLLIPMRYPVPISCTILVALFIGVQGFKSLRESIRYTAFAVAPIAIMLTIVWVILVGTPPHLIGITQNTNRIAALSYVLTLTVRLLLFVFLVHSALSSRLNKAPMKFLSQLALPLPVRQTIAMMLSVASTIRNSTERTWVALVAANIITRKRSLRNILHIWLFLQTVWTFMVSTINERMSGKWKIEDIETMLEGVFVKRKYVPTMKDLFWISFSILAIASTIVLERK
jgi:hypothetical protein